MNLIQYFSENDRFGTHKSQEGILKVDQKLRFGCNRIKDVVYSISINFRTFIWQKSNNQIRKYKKGVHCMVLRVKKALIATIVCGTALVVNSQIITFNSPIPWVTQRNDSIVVRAQIDTSQTKQKKINFTLSQVMDGKKKSILTKQFKITDVSGEFFLGMAKRDLVGGTEFLRVDYSLEGTSEKGTIEPIGILNVDKMPKAEQIKAIHVKENATPEAVNSAVSSMITVGTQNMGFAWNKNSLFWVIKKSADTNTLQIILDGKNGKNSFLSYPDRIIAYVPSKDSTWGTHYNREISADSLKYIEKNWKHNISKKTVGDKTVIMIPWYDTGIIPFEERTIGMGIFQLAGKRLIQSIPNNAKPLIPGTWTDILLQK